MHGVSLWETRKSGDLNIHFLESLDDAIVMAKCLARAELENAYENEILDKYEYRDELWNIKENIVKEKKWSADWSDLELEILVPKD